MSQKKDRTARLVRVEHLLCQNPRGLKARELARLCDVSLRTSYRDLRALQDELKLPIWQDEESRYGLDRTYYLPPISLTLLEAMALYVSARLVSRYSDKRDRNVESAFVKLASALPPSIAEHVQETVTVMAGKPENEQFARVFDILTTAWATRRSVRIWYARTGTDGAVHKVYDRLLDPYFIEPSGAGHSCYVIGHDHYSRQVRTFKVERIQDIELTAREFTVPAGWSAAEHLRSSWGIMHEDEVEVQIRFSRAAAARVKESIWHPSQVLIEEPAGTLLFSVRVAGTLEIAPWILSWGAEAEVLAPPEFRNQFQLIATRQARTYGALAAEENLSQASPGVRQP